MVAMAHLLFACIIETFRHHQNLPFRNSEQRTCRAARKFVFSRAQRANVDLGPDFGPAAYRRGLVHGFRDPSLV
jgi:hypothetical protein